MLNKIIILILSITFTFAKGGGSGGGSFGGYHNANKYGALKVSTSQTGLSENLYLKTFSHVRYKNWFTIHDWKSGYATSTLVDSKGGRVKAQSLEIKQRNYIHRVERNGRGDVIGEYYVLGGVEKTEYKNNSSYMKLNLNLCDGSGTVLTVHKVTINGKKFGNYIENDWEGKGKAGKLPPIKF